MVSSHLETTTLNWCSISLITNQHASTVVVTYPSHVPVSCCRPMEFHFHKYKLAMGLHVQVLCLHCKLALCPKPFSKWYFNIYLGTSSQATSHNSCKKPIPTATTSPFSEKNKQGSTPSSSNKLSTIWRKREVSGSIVGSITGFTCSSQVSNRKDCHRIQYSAVIFQGHIDVHSRFHFLTSTPISQVPVFFSPWVLKKKHPPTKKMVAFYENTTLSTDQNFIPNGTSPNITALISSHGFTASGRPDFGASRNDSTGADSTTQVLKTVGRTSIRKIILL